ncbi:hypothetical protein [Gordonia alkanivorans]|uniref:hypothetical protein n=1 Tax=Gordonia alkanivorans TaxID=84096 RepID=UPI0024498766|nr:hypothetical protein [Gordonia alkanivorans]MDH3022665.1 hypothetical protein [Gordonia alkanivorans]MDJ0010375.1 hypothetical protein [Gordonia alkanivorans]MDJ0100211.1 hypothetical protein [Gordonia alkanivorans]MDJ0496008.1 hypothetical protein [Gordonia alkanivorans]
MSARWQTGFDQFAALRHLRDDDYAAMLRAAAEDPLTAQVRAASAPDRHRRDGRAAPYSPDARLHPDISDAIDRSRNLKVEPCGVIAPWVYSNCGRRGARGGSEAHLREVTFAQAVEEHGPQAVLELQRREREYEVATEVAEYGGSPVATVTLYSPRGVGNLGFLVSPGWSKGRVARLATRSHRVPDCFFCPYYSETNPVDMFLEVECGAVLKLFPACSSCEPRLARGDEWLIHDWELAWDPWDREQGWPDDRFR